MTSILPPNSTELERALERLADYRADDIDVPLRDLVRADTCPEHLLPFLAWWLSVDDWSPDWLIATRRGLVRDAIPIARMKGTSASVRDIVASFGGSVAIREWWQTEPKGDPHTFSLVMNLGQAGVPATAAFVDQVIRAVRRAKPVRSHFTFTQGITARGGVGVRAVARPAVYARLRCLARPAPPVLFSRHSDGASFADGSRYMQRAS